MRQVFTCIDFWLAETFRLKFKLMAVTLCHFSVICMGVRKSVTNNHDYPPHVYPYVCLHVS